MGGDSGEEKKRRMVPGTSPESFECAENETELRSRIVLGWFGSKTVMGEERGPDDAMLPKHKDPDVSTRSVLISGSMRGSPYTCWAVSSSSKEEE